MKQFTHLIIGGGIAGTTAAETIRKKDPKASIGIVNDEPHRLYSRIMLSKPNFFLGKIPFKQIWLRDEQWYDKNNITFLGGKKATQLNHQDKTVTLDDESKIQYDKLLIATGVKVRKLPIPGADKKGVFYLRTLDHGTSIIEAVKSIKKAITVGGGFISFEMANLLQLAGADVTIVIRESRFWGNIMDENASTIVENAIENSGVKIIRNADIKEIVGDENVSGIILNNDTEIPTDMIVCGIGASCEVDWLKEAGIKINRAVLTNEQMETSIPNIWAAGDGIEYADPILEEVLQLGNWVNAQEHGRVAGLNMTGEDAAFNLVSFYTTHGFDISVTFIGNVRPQNKVEIITRKGEKENEYIQLIVNKNKIIGGILVNQTKVMQPITQLIKNKTDISNIKEQLADHNIDLKSIINT